MTKKYTKASVVACVALGLAACGGFDEADGKAAWGATKKAMAPASGTGSPLSAESEFTADCTGGGTADFVDSAAVNNTSTLTNVQFSFDVTFTGCIEDGVQMDGSLSYSGAVTTDSMAGSTSVSLDYAGSIAYSGDVESECDVDMHLGVETGATGSTVDISGNFCGMSAEDIADGDDASGIGGAL